MFGNLYVIALTLGSLLTSLIVCYFAIPIIINVAREKKLIDVPNNRSSHSKAIPSLGGIALFTAFCLAFLFFSNGYLIREQKFIIAAVLIMFLVGVKDDLMSISPSQKIIGETTAALIVTILGDLRFTSFHGLLGIYELPYIISIVFTCFIIIVITNGFNLIDGIDGLASGISGICSFTFGVYFLLIKDYEYLILTSTLFGALISFFRYNVFSEKNKIFMGDSGSLIIGLLISILVIRFNEVAPTVDSIYQMTNASIISIGILAVPLFDVSRVMFIRFKNKRSPFSPDKNHVHHRLLSLGYKHIYATIRIMAVNILFVFVSFYFCNSNRYILLILIVGLGIFFSWLPSYLLHKKVKKKLKSRVKYC